MEQIFELIEQWEADRPADISIEDVCRRLRTALGAAGECSGTQQTL